MIFGGGRFMLLSERSGIDFVRIFYSKKASRGCHRKVTFREKFTDMIFRDLSELLISTHFRRFSIQFKLHELSYPTTRLNRKEMEIQVEILRLETTNVSSKSGKFSASGKSELPTCFNNHLTCKTRLRLNLMGFKWNFLCGGNSWSLIS